jgi:Zn-dependent peptidase ImmA (M78 family)
VGIDPLPDLIAWLEARGIKVLGVDSEARLDALAAHVHRAGREPVRVIVIRTGVPGERQRVHLAHALDHMLMEVAGDDQCCEQAAHRFAGVFLMPAEALWSNVGRHRRAMGWRELFALKEVFGASRQAITDRCRALGIFPPPLSQRLLRACARVGYRSAPKYEPHPLPEEQPGRFERLCDRALAEGALSEPTTAEWLDITVRELHRRMEEPTAAAVA